MKAIQFGSSVEGWGPRTASSDIDIALVGDPSLPKEQRDGDLHLLNFHLLPKELRRRILLNGVHVAIEA